MERILSTAAESTSTIAAYAFAIASTLEQQGVPPETVFERCGISLPATTDPMLRFTQSQITLIRPEPVACWPQFDGYFHCEISFDNPDLVIALPTDIIDLPLPGASKELAQIHDNTAMDYLSRLDKADIVNRVRKIVVEDLLSTTVSIERVAERLCMSSRSLQGKLADRGTSFQEILDSTREGLALGYIEQSNLSITEAAYMLGFSDVANFTRAFKRWTGKSPREYRKEKGMEK
jgi:AraC-like DNA-binding protein